MDQELDLRLKELRGRISQVDPLLVRLLNFATSAPGPIQYGLVLLLDGVIVSGVPESSTLTGEVLDNQSLKFFQSMQAMDISAGGDGGNWPEIINIYQEISPFSSQAKKDSEARTDFLKKIGDTEFKDPTELLDHPDNLAEEAVYVLIPPKAFTLRDVQIRSGGTGIWENVPSMRVNLSSVQAWWTFDLGVPEEAREALAKLQQNAEE